jgi:carbon starvation protein
MPPLLALTLFHHDPAGRLVLHAMPVMVVALLVLALAYRYYSAFLAAKVAALDDSRPTPAVRLNDGQNYHPTNKWVAFGHHFAAISGAGPLIGPVLAIQYGYMPGLIWLLVGVCLAGAVQDMLVLAASVRRDGKSLAEIARHELGRPAAIVASLAILFIIVIALAGLGMVVVKALGGEEVKLPAGMQIITPSYPTQNGDIWSFPPNCRVAYALGEVETVRSESFQVRIKGQPLDASDSALPARMILPAGCSQVVPGSSWGTFTIACTIPIALLVGLWMYKVRKGRVVEASLVGGLLTLAAVVAGGSVPGSVLEPFFSLTKNETIVALGTYGFIAAVLPVWLLLGPRDYLSSFLKIGTIALLVGSVIVANPPLRAPMLNETFLNGGPTFQGSIFPFVFICVMCGAVSGFHSLVSSGTTPKMIEKESHVRPIGYGAMLMEGLVGITALIAAAALPNGLYYDINIAIDKTHEYQKDLAEIERKYGHDPLLAVGGNLQHLDLGSVEQKVGGESLRGRTGGAVTLAVGMSVVFEDAFRWLGVAGESMLKYWYHFAIMFEALFILTTIDAGTRIGRFLLQETLGRVDPRFARPDWLPGSLLASAVITFGWSWLIYTGNIGTIWSMFGIANQTLAILALSLVSVWLANNGRIRYLFVTVLPMLWVCSTTSTAAFILVTQRFPAMYDKGEKLTAVLNMGLTIFIVCSVGSLVIWSMAKCASVAMRPKG